MTIEKLRARKNAQAAADEAMKSLVDNDEAEIELWGCLLKDKMPQKLAASLVSEFMQQFGFDEQYAGGVRPLLLAVFSALPKRCNTLRKALGHQLFEVPEALQDSNIALMTQKMIDALKARRGAWSKHERLWANWQAVAERLEQFDSHGATNDVDRQEKRDLLAYLNSGFCRTLPKQLDTRKVLALARQYPNFAEVVNYMAGQVALAKRKGQGGANIPAVLLLGPPGAGKTAFAQALAKCLKTSVQLTSMSSQSSGFGLAGLNRGWSTARPGDVFSALLHGQALAPVFVLDEIDKVPIDSRSPPLGALYTLLEPHAANRFMDEYVGFAVDASSIVWVATANDLDAIPPALLSRFVVFDIALPTPGQMQRVVKNLYKKLAADYPGAPSCLPKKFLMSLADQSPRALRLTLHKALGAAALRSAKGSPLCLRHTDFDGLNTPKPLSAFDGVGFLAKAYGADRKSMKVL